jgi:glycine hydroxymethyltransferase
MTTSSLIDAERTAARLDELVDGHTEWRDGGTINLNAATNSLSPRARAALSTSLAEKGISSGLHSRHHQGGRYIDEIEEIVFSMTARAFQGESAELRPPTGSLANAVAIASLVEKDRSVMVGGANTLGHFSLRQAGWGGRLASSVTHVPFLDDGVTIDIAELNRVVDETRPAMIVVGSQAMLFPLDLAALRIAADRVGALVVYDAAHPLGIIAGGRFQAPLVEGADIITASTQKSFPGPVGGVIVTRTAATMAPIYAATNQLMSNYQNNRVLAFGYTMAEMQAFGGEYADATIANTRFLAQEFARLGLAPLFADRGFTESNIFLVPWGSHDDAEAFARLCERANIIVSTTLMPGPEGREPLYGLRIGVQDLTRHGLDRQQLAEVAQAVTTLAGDGSQADTIGRRMTELAAETTTVYYSFEAGLPRPA